MSESTNWVANQSWEPGRVARPSTAEEVAALLREAGEAGSTAKAAGSRYSLTGSAATDGVQIVLELLSGVVEVDLSKHLVRARGGTKISNLNKALHAHGMALENLGDMDQQTLAGATATGTHGSGAGFGGLATMVRSLEIALPDGSLVECSAEHEPDLFDAARVSLGALGVVTELTLEVLPSFRLHVVEEPRTLTEALVRLGDDVADTDHYELQWYPHTDRVMTKYSTRLAPDDPRDEPRPGWRRLVDKRIVEHVVLEGVNRACSMVPVITPAAKAVTAQRLSRREYTAFSHEVFVHGHRPRFIETEYAVPAPVVKDVLLELKAWTDDAGSTITHPVKVRFSAPDDLWMSPSYQRQSAWISVQQYHRMDHVDYFAAFEDIVAAHDGRPHWGKLHRLGAKSLARLYPRYEDFLAMRERVDPKRVMSNQYLRRVLGD
ncbi:MAG: FAD-binding protein [Austwickia sp.]|jgi:FAD-linked oxidoreductase|nr:FAD-binding protein [Austwickia sp.]MBK8437522.1 FAD-binding protein [Austwickia sp.]MBK9102788.1 FAD-binding protein [Austwickia sp.]